MIVVLPVILLLLTGRSFSQTTNAISHIKKPLIYQIGNVVHINADGERPLLRALEALPQKYSWIVDYEEPQYSREADRTSTADSPPSRRHANARNGSREAFSTEFTVGPTPDSSPDENAVLTTVVGAYNDGSAIAQFELRNESNAGKDNSSRRQHEQRFDVVGIIAIGHQNDTQSQQPILDLPITLRKEPRSAAQTISAICDEVSKKSKVSVGVGAIDDTTNGDKRVAIGGTDVPARALLSSTVTSMRDHLSWRLLYDSGSKSYKLNVIGLPQ
jgi:hypothetical protein